MAVFGKPAGGKSTLAEQIARTAGVPLIQLDLIQYKCGGGKVPHEEFLTRHRELLSQDEWVIDGFGTPQTFEAMLRAADVLVYVERATLIHFLVGHKTLNQKSVCEARRVAREESDGRVHAQQLPLLETVAALLDTRPEAAAPADASRKARLLNST